MEAEDEVFFISRDVAALDARAEVVHPTEATALPTAEKPRLVGQHPPPSLAFFLYVVAQKLVLLRRPWPPLQPCPLYLLARDSSHLYASFHFLVLDFAFNLIFIFLFLIY